MWLQLRLISPTGNIFLYHHEVQLLDVNGEAVFIITAKNKTGNAKVKFRYEKLKDTVKVKVIK